MHRPLNIATNTTMRLMEVEGHMEFQDVRRLLAVFYALSLLPYAAYYAAAWDGYERIWYVWIRSFPPFRVASFAAGMAQAKLTLRALGRDCVAGSGAGARRPRYGPRATRRGWVVIRPRARRRFARLGWL